MLLCNLMYMYINPLKISVLFLIECFSSYSVFCIAAIPLGSGTQFRDHNSWTFTLVFITMKLWIEIWLIWIRLTYRGNIIRTHAHRVVVDHSSSKMHERKLSFIFNPSNLVHYNRPPPPPPPRETRDCVLWRRCTHHYTWDAYLDAAYPCY